MHDASTDRPLAFASGDAWLYGILSLPPGPAQHAAGVVIVVGGPQYRAGSHRQFTLLARALAASGTPVLRFDYRGMGDSDGEVCGFEHAGADLRAAIDRFCTEVPGLERVALWGLCDGATAAALYAPQDPRVGAVAMLNPWVRTEQGAARAAIRHYYRGRLFDKAFWRKVRDGRFDWKGALASLWSTLSAARRAAPDQAREEALPARLHAALERFTGKILILLSGADLTAQEFDGLARDEQPWRVLLAQARVTRHRIEGADHTLSRRAWHEEATRRTLAWLNAG